MASRVAQLDAVALDQELYTLLGSSILQSNLLNWNSIRNKNTEEIKLIIKSLIFICSTKYSVLEGVTRTYGSQLNGVSFKCRKSSLYLLTILSDYFNKKLSHYFFSSNPASTTLHNQDILRKLYSRLSKIYDIAYLLNLCVFISSSGRTNKNLYLTPIFRLFKIGSITDPIHLSSSSFYQDSIYGGLEYQNRQLLWNAILEVFNNTLLLSHKFYYSRSYIMNNKRKKKVQAKKQQQTGDSGLQCPKCENFPVNPYRMTCCQGIYCYVCVSYVLKRGYCLNCDETNDLSAQYIYHSSSTQPDNVREN
ncbi:ubiquitin-protein ligase peroxin 2 NDAI_0G01650 [Naumovozyma dairenensis CBS 421]|uniref:Uncharacterized protein n=1 Tax=Naumovozyma dairenensis (strain ATCC 10597 / BCRC 20456 / CBS 421 / NBRC 0211 / NRRL Y-12639) TaxID=1071378 RepID=G0WDT0_NAUDC|nr:hypothetical protein NDAI_0G01650 [Naumovozyma dairenensis CBS 421]CCD25941.2 hypothetical protein NDAI_0G01650 [Naumovozyma dairenensis CBS 421]